MSYRLSRSKSFAGFLIVAGLLLAAGVSAEPYLAVQKGMKCALCHTSPSGGGKTTICKKLLDLHKNWWSLGLL